MCQNALGVCPELLGKLELCPYISLSRNWECLLLKGEGREGDRMTGRKGREWVGRLASHTIFRPWTLHLKTKTIFLVLEKSESRDQGSKSRDYISVTEPQTDRQTCSSQYTASGVFGILVYGHLAKETFGITNSGQEKESV